MRERLIYGCWAFLFAGIFIGCVLHFLKPPQVVFAIVGAVAGVGMLICAWCLIRLNDREWEKEQQWIRNRSRNYE